MHNFFCHSNRIFKECCLGTFRWIINLLQRHSKTKKFLVNHFFRFKQNRNFFSSNIFAMAASDVVLIAELQFMWLNLSTFFISLLLSLSLILSFSLILSPTLSFSLTRNFLLSSLFLSLSISPSLPLSRKGRSAIKHVLEALARFQKQISPIRCKRVCYFNFM